MPPITTSRSSAPAPPGSPPRAASPSAGHRHRHRGPRPAGWPCRDGHDARRAGRSRLRMAAFGRSQSADGDCPLTRFLGRRETTRLGSVRRVHADTAEQEEWHAASLAFHARVEAAAAERMTARLQRCSRRAIAGTSCSTRSAPGPTGSSSIAYRCTITGAMPTAVPIGAFGRATAACSRGSAPACRCSRAAMRVVDHRSAAIAVETERGRVRSRAVLITLPPTVLAAEAVRFTPRSRRRSSPRRTASSSASPTSSSWPRRKIPRFPRR